MHTTLTAESLVAGNCDILVSNGRCSIVGSLLICKLDDFWSEMTDVVMLVDVAAATYFGDVGRVTAAYFGKWQIARLCMLEAINDI